LSYGLDILFSIVKESTIQDGKSQLNFENFDATAEMDQKGEEYPVYNKNKEG
jgi:hypothetical protein